MRFISQYPNYGVQVHKQRVHPLGDGTVQTVQEGLYAKFTAADAGAMIYEKERREAEDRFIFHGRQQEQDLATPVDIIHRLSVLDTVEDAERNGWSPDDVAEIEETLSRLCVETPNAVILIQGTPIPPPFPLYDHWDGDAQELVLKLTGDGFDLSEVLNYETVFGPKRPDVIEALREGIEALEELTVRG